MRENNYLYRNNLTIGMQREICGKCSYLNKCYSGIGNKYVTTDAEIKTEISGAVDTLNAEDERLAQKMEDDFANLAYVTKDKYSGLNLTRFLVDNMREGKITSEMLELYSHILTNVGA